MQVGEWWRWRNLFAYNHLFLAMRGGTGYFRQTFYDFRTLSFAKSEILTILYFRAKKFLWNSIPLPPQVFLEVKNVKNFAKVVYFRQIWSQCLRSRVLRNSHEAAKVRNENGAKRWQQTRWFVEWMNEASPFCGENKRSGNERYESI